MSLLDDIIKLKIKELVKMEKGFTFPIFIKALRKTIGLPRSKVAEFMGVAISQIIMLERGLYRKEPDYHLIAGLAALYGASEKLLLRKCKEYQVFCEKKQNGNGKDKSNAI